MIVAAQHPAERVADIKTVRERQKQPSPQPSPGGGEGSRPRCLASDIDLKNRVDYGFKAARSSRRIS